MRKIAMCPCGAEAKVVQEKYRFRVKCTRCRLDGYAEETQDGAIIQWNQYSAKEYADLRDNFAMDALPALLDNGVYMIDPDNDHARALAIDAYSIADAMIEARRPQTGDNKA